MNYRFSYTGTKICQNCTDKALSTYLFIYQTLNSRRQIDTCITAILEPLANIIEEPNKNLIVELNETLIVPITDNELSIEDLFDDDLDETQLKVDVLEDQYRIEPSSESEDEKTEFKSKETDDHSTISPYVENKLQNGLRNNNNTFEFSEFLTFKKKEEVKKANKKARYSCDLCSKTFITVYFLTKHLLRHLNKTVVCNQCNLECKSKFCLLEHVKANHLDKETNCSSCEVCGRAFTDERKKEKHRETHSKRQCSICNKIFVSQKYYNSHLQRHMTRFKLTHRKARETCSFCESECLTKNKLSVHVNKVHLQIKPYSCDMCERKFYTKFNLTNHKKLHSLKSKEKCEFCGANMKCRRDLVIHVRRHMGFRPHACFLCIEAFYSERELNCHMNKLHGGKVICNICKTVFLKKSELKFHNRTSHNTCQFF